MKDLTNVDIVTINCTKPSDGLKAIKHCMKNFKFGRAIMITHEDVSDPDVEIFKINKLNSVDEYNDYVLRLKEYVNNDYVLVVQDDGFIVNPNNWDDNFLSYDYIGAPWSSNEDTNWIELQNETIKQHLYDTLGRNRVGNGGFSLRSKKFIEYSAQFTTCNGMGEDAFLNVVNYDKAVEAGILYPTFELAKKFSYENDLINDKIRNPDRVMFNREHHFGFHGHNFINSKELINLKN
jgi:hypothetical protein